MGTAGGASKEQRLHDEIVAFFNYVSPTPDERHARAVVIAQISDVVRRRFAKSSVDTFGSVAQNLYLPDGDTDLVVNTAHPYDDDMKKRALFQLAALMRNTGVTPHVQVIPRARVPLMSFQTVPDLGSLKIDISLNSTDGMKAVPILKDWFDRLPALRFLVLCVKSLLSRHALNNASTSGLSSYGVICLAISFLQLNPLRRAPEPAPALGVLLDDFLHYYGDLFDYEHGVVSVASASVLSKEEKGWESASSPGALCIECMLNPENDVGRPTSKIKQIRRVFREAHAALDAYVLPASPEVPNILGTVLGISESTLAHRALLREIVVSGRLARALENVQMSSIALAQTGAAYAYPRRQQQQQYQHQRHHSNSRPYAHGQNQNQSTMNPPPARGLPAKPPLPSQNAHMEPAAAPAHASASTSISAANGHGNGNGTGNAQAHGSPPRAQKTAYVAQGPTLATLAAEARASAEARAQKERGRDGHTNGDGNQSKDKGDAKAKQGPPEKGSAKNETEKATETANANAKGKAKARGKGKAQAQAQTETKTNALDDSGAGAESKAGSSSGSSQGPPRRRRKA